MIAMENSTAPTLCFGDLPELDHVIALLGELASVADHQGSRHLFADDGLINNLVSRIDKQAKWQRDESEQLHPGAFDRSYLAEEYAEACYLLREVEFYPWELPANLNRLVLRLHRVMILGNLTEGELHDILAERTAAIEEAAALRPIADHGKKFKGRKPGSGGPIRKAVARLLKKYPALKNPELWDEIKSRPPRGWSVFDNSHGKYIEGPKAGDGMKRAHFCTVCSEERKKIKEKITG
jgi:hypothetical protein